MWSRTFTFYHQPLLLLPPHQLLLSFTLSLHYLVLLPDPEAFAHAAFLWNGVKNLLIVHIVFKVCPSILPTVSYPKIFSLDFGCWGW